MKEALELLIYSFDNELKAEEQNKLETALLASPELREERRKYLKMRASIAKLSFAVEEPFEEQVLQKWKRPRSNDNFHHNVIRLFPKVAAAAILFFLITWSSLHFGGDNIDMNTFLLLDEISQEEAIKLLERME